MHTVKLQTQFAKAILAGEKKCEVRFDDRDYQSGDSLSFQLVDGEIPKMEYLQSVMEQHIISITHVLRGGQFGIKDGWVVLSINIQSNDR